MSILCAKIEVSIRTLGCAWEGNLAQMGSGSIREMASKFREGQVPGPEVWAAPEGMGGVYRERFQAEKAGSVWDIWMCIL